MKRKSRNPEWGETDIVRKNDIVRHYGICATAVDKRIARKDFPKTVFPRVSGVPLLFNRREVEDYFSKHPVSNKSEAIPPLVEAITDEDVTNLKNRVRYLVTTVCSLQDDREDMRWEIALLKKMLIEVYTGLGLELPKGVEKIGDYR